MPLAIFAKSSILDVRLGSKYTSAKNQISIKSIFLRGYTYYVRRQSNFILPKIMAACSKVKKNSPGENLKMAIRKGCFYMNFAKYLRTCFFQLISFYYPSYLLNGVRQVGNRPQFISQKISCEMSKHNRVLLFSLAN